jgi:hypothetical protein
VEQGEKSIRILILTLGGDIGEMFVLTSGGTTLGWDFDGFSSSK